MDWLTVNRFKTYRSFRWNRSEYLWKNPWLEKYRIRVLNDSSGPQDILAIPCPHLPGKETYINRDNGLSIKEGHRGDLEYTDTPMICDNSMDYAYMDPPVRDTLQHPQVRAFLAGVTFRDQISQQRKTWGGEYYGHVLRNMELFNSGPDVRCDRNLPDGVMQKIKLFRPPTPTFDDDVYGYIEKNMKALKDREIDVFFSGRAVYHPKNIRNHPTAHRRQLEKAWPKFPGKNKVLVTYDNWAGNRRRGKPCKNYAYPWEYVNMLLNSKVVISPWGWSPWCVRDLEALICGCLVIKPECSNVLVYPDIYNPANLCMIWCDVFFKSVAGQLSYIYSNLKDFQERADYGRAFIAESLYPRDKLFNYWTGHLRALLDEILETTAFRSAV